MICHWKNKQTNKQTTKTWCQRRKTSPPSNKRSWFDSTERERERDKAIEKNRRCERACSIPLPWQQWIPKSMVELASVYVCIWVCVCVYVRVCVCWGSRGMDVTAERILLRLKKKKCVNSIGVQRSLDVIHDGCKHAHVQTRTHTHTFMFWIYMVAYSTWGMNIHRRDDRLVSH